MLLARVLFIKFSSGLRKLLHFLEGPTTLEKIQKSVKRPPKEIRRRRQSTASTIVLRRPWTSFSFGPLYGPLVQSSVQKCGDQSGKSLYLRTVVTSWSYCSRGKWRIDYQNYQSSPFRGSQACFEDFSRFSWQIHGGAKPPLKGIIKAWQFWLIQNNFESFNSFFTKRGLKIRNFRPIKIVYRISPNVKLSRHIC